MIKKRKKPIKEENRYIILGVIMLLISFALYPELNLFDSVLLIMVTIITIGIGIKKKLSRKN